MELGLFFSFYFHFSISKGVTEEMRGANTLGSSTMELVRNAVPALLGWLQWNHSSQGTVSWHHLSSAGLRVR